VPSGSGPGFTVLAKGEPGDSLSSYGWAHDGRYVTVSAYSTAGGQPSVVTHIFDSHGGWVSDVGGGGFLWVEDGYLLDLPTGIWRGQVGSDNRILIADPYPTYDGWWSLGDDRFVFMRSTAPEYQVDRWTYWVDGRPGPEREGLPEALSMDGAEIVVIHVRPEAVEVEGWLEVVELGTGRVVRSWPDLHVSLKSFPIFNRDGTCVFASGSMLEIASGRVEPIGADGDSWLGWDSENRMVMLNSAKRSVSAWDCSGKAQPASVPYGNWIFLSPGGSAAVIEMGNSQLRLWSSEGERTITLTDRILDAQWAPDESSVLLITDVDLMDGREKALLVHLHL
jgi:hypothetical protein